MPLVQHPRADMEFAHGLRCRGHCQADDIGPGANAHSLWSGDVQLQRESRPMIPTITLNNGTPIPQLGFGTLKIPPDRAPMPENARKTADVVGLALQIGYRHIDTAQMYGNEMGVGLALAESGIARDEIYITTKLGNANHRPDDVRHSFDQSMERLDLDHLDLFLKIGRASCRKECRSEGRQHV